MSVASAGRTTSTSVRLRATIVEPRYRLEALSGYLIGVQKSWEEAYRLSGVRAVILESEPLIQSLDLAFIAEDLRERADQAQAAAEYYARLRDAEEQRPYENTDEDHADAAPRASLETPGLDVVRLHLGSPLDMTLAVQGGATAASVYAVHLLVATLRDPNNLGAWLPRVLAGWHQGMHDLERARLLRGTLGADSSARELEEAAEWLGELGKPVEVVAEGAGEPPGELT